LGLDLFALALAASVIVGLQISFKFGEKVRMFLEVGMKRGIRFLRHNVILPTVGDIAKICRLWLAKCVKSLFYICR